jgi:hypothetical protein
MGKGGNRRIWVLRQQTHTEAEEGKLATRDPSIHFSGSWSCGTPSPRNVIHTLAQFCQYSKILLSFYWNYYFLLYEDRTNFLATDDRKVSRLKAIYFRNPPCNGKAAKYKNVQAGVISINRHKTWASTQTNFNSRLEEQGLRAGRLMNRCSIPGSGKINAVFNF